MAPRSRLRAFLADKSDQRIGRENRL